MNCADDHTLLSLRCRPKKYTAVNPCVIRLYLSGNHGERRIGVFGGLVFSAIGAVSDIWLLVSVEKAALVLGLVYLCWITRLFRQAPPEVAI